MTVETTHTSTTFDSSSGLKVDLLYPTEEMITIEDIATGLSRCCRFAGQINSLYTVAQHSVIISRLVPKKLRLAGLLHDGSEAYLGDVIKPLKNLIKELYGPIEQRMNEVIFRKFGIPIEQLSLIKPFDRVCFDQEVIRFRKGYAQPWIDFNNSINCGINAWEPETAYTIFLMEFKAITGDTN